MNILMENPMRKALFFLFLFLAALAAITAPQIAAIRTLKTQVMLMENVIADLKTRISLREIPKIHCTSATIFVSGSEITVKTEEQ
jgi:hypothetical protein